MWFPAPHRSQRSVRYLFYFVVGSLGYENLNNHVSNTLTIIDDVSNASLEQQQSIFEYLKKEDQLLLLFIKFVSYSFIRPIEVCRLKVKDINIDTKTVQFKAKNSPLKTKIIPSILFDALPDLSKMDKESFLFTPDKIGAFWDANETNRRDHFSKRFRRVVKDHFKLNKDYGIYSFRHTFISKLYRKLRENSAHHRNGLP